MQVYEIVIDEEQRLILTEALQLLVAIAHTTEAKTELLQMLTELPTNEAKNPGTLHGLCY